MKTWHTDSRGWTQEEWFTVCARYHGRVLEGQFCHFCNDWDDLPIDETCPEFDGCTCFGSYKDMAKDDF